MQDMLQNKKHPELNNQDYILEIGKIRLNLRHYPGEDLYCDGEVEDELLEIARNYSQAEYRRIIEERKSWPVLYHLSPLRENIVEWLPITTNMKVLEIGAGCGAITGALARKAQEVTCIDLSKKRSMINAYRHMECDNVTIHVGNFQDVEPDLPCDYDYICLIGVFEYGQAYINSDTPYEDFLKIIRKHVKKDGHIAIAIENKFGLKYWAGCREDHLGTYFSGLEGYPDGGVVRTFTRDGLCTIAEKCGFEQIQMYYPYPDYKFMTSLYSDERLPQQGELTNNMRNFDRDRLQLFDEKRVFDTILQEKEFPLFSNSYMMILGPELEEKYVKYSNDRAEEYTIKTVLVQNREGKQIQKYPLGALAQEHIRKTVEAGEKLKERYRGSALGINKCELKTDEDGSPYAVFEFVEGVTLEQLLDGCLAKGDTEAFHRLFDLYRERISYGEECHVTDYDLIFSNILIDTEESDGQLSPKEIAEKKWTVIDYEWTFERSIDTNEVAFRAVYCYLLENEKRNQLDFAALLEKLQISQADAEGYRRQEMNFQKHVTGKNSSMAEIREAIGNPVYTLEAFCKGQEIRRNRDKIQIYEDTGMGFREEQSFFLEEQSGEEVVREASGMTRIHVPLESGRSAVRIDPCNDYCVVYLKEVLWNGAVLPFKGKRIQTNGFRIGENTYAFMTQDPNISVSLYDLANEEKNLLQVSMEVTKLPEETVRHMQRKGLF